MTDDKQSVEKNDTIYTCTKYVYLTSTATPLIQILANVHELFKGQSGAFDPFDYC